MVTQWFRQTFRWLVDPVAKVLGRLGLSANGLTILGCLLNIGVAVVIATGRMRLGGILLIITSTLDAVDGALARHVSQPTKYGAFLDSVLDRVSESAVLLAVAWYYMAQPGQVDEMLAYVAIVGSFLVSYARGRAEGLGIDCKVGVFTRAERCIVIIVALILGLVRQGLWILAVGSILTALHRVVYVYTQVKDEPL